MKRLILFTYLWAAAGALMGDDSPTVDLIAGWGWSPFYYDRYPCGYGPYWRGYPSAGLGVPLNPWNASAPYGYYDYAPFWGYETGVRISLKDKRLAPVLSEGLLQPFPGSAPTELRDLQREQQWNADFETLLGSRPSKSKSTALTNSAPTKLLIPNS